MSVLVEDSPVLAWTIATATTDVFVSAHWHLFILHTTVRVVLLELRVYHVLLRICTEPSKGLSAHSELYPEFSPWLVGPWMIHTLDRLSDLTSQHSPLPDSAAATLTSSTFLSPAKPLLSQDLCTDCSVSWDTLDLKNHIPNIFASSGGLPWP